MAATAYAAARGVDGGQALLRAPDHGILGCGEGARPRTEIYWVSLNSSFQAPQHSWKTVDQIPKNCIIENLKVKIQSFLILRSMVLQFNQFYFYIICLEIFK